MKKLTKRNILMAFALSAVCSFGVAAVTLTASAEDEAPVARTEDVFFDGASVYLGDLENNVDRSGIRFCVVAKESVLNDANKTVGAVLAFADHMAGDTELTVDDEYVSKNIQVLSTNSAKWQESTKYTVEGDTYKCAYVYIYDFTADAYNRIINFNPYVLSNGEYTYAGTEGRSMAQVAVAAVAKGVTEASKYVKSYGVNYYYGEDKMSYSTSAVYGSTITAPTVTENDFLGWYADKELTKEFDFTQTVTGTVNVYAKFKANETIDGTYATFNLSSLDNYSFVSTVGAINNITIAGKDLAFTQESNTVTVANATVKALNLAGDQTVVIDTDGAYYTTTFALTSDGYVTYAPSAIQMGYSYTGNSFLSTNNEGYTVYTADGSGYDTRTLKILDRGYVAGQYVAVEIYLNNLPTSHLPHFWAGHFYAWENNGAASKVAIYDKVTKASVAAEDVQTNMWYVVVMRFNTNIASAGGYNGTFAFLNSTFQGCDGKTMLINNSYVFDNESTFNNWIAATKLEGAKQYAPNAVQDCYLGGVASPLSMDANGYRVYTGDGNEWSLRTSKLASSWSAGQYVAIEIYLNNLGSARLPYFWSSHVHTWSAAKVGVYDKATKTKLADAGTMQDQTWYILVFRYDSAVANVQGYDGDFTFFNSRFQGCAGKTMLINNSYVFDNETVFNTWLNA